MGVFSAAAGALDLTRRMCDAVDVMSIHTHGWTAPDEVGTTRHCPPRH